MNTQPIPRIARGALLVLAFAVTSAASAADALCAGARCQPTITDGGYVEAARERLITQLQVATTSGTQDVLQRAEMSDQEYFSFSGVGAIVCTVNGKQVASTAFLVGAFDIGVTVAHPFANDGAWAEPQSCVYTSTDSVGQIRERIPVSYIKAQWQAEADSFGQPSKDFAVVRLSEPSKFAQRTMPLGKFSGMAAPVLMIGFQSDIATDTLKRKSRGRVYEKLANGISESNVGFIHDMDSRGIAAGAPVIDERSGVIIGVHTVLFSSARPGAASRNTMITMNDWLEKTLRLEMASAITSKAN